MAYFYLAKVVTLTKDGTNPVVTTVMTQAQRFVTEDWTYHKEDGTTIAVTFPKPKYEFQMQFVYDAAQNPTRALIRADGMLNVGDYDQDMTTKTEAQWQQLYTTYPRMAQYPFIDAPYQPA